MFKNNLKNIKLLTYNIMWFLQNNYYQQWKGYETIYVIVIYTSYCISIYHIIYVIATQ